MTKRTFDIFLSFIALIFLMPVFVVLIVLVFFLIGRSIFFIQRRIGLGGVAFRLIKFRTMTSDLDDKGMLLPDSVRLTSFGRFLRATSLDELPEFWNVLKGEMSLVGPRPLLEEYLPLYTPEQARRHAVRPGITGWAQVNGRNSLSWEEKFQLDVWYIENQNFWLDIKILLLTFKKVFLREDINAPGDETMPRFTGSLEQGSEQ